MLNELRLPNPSRESVERLQAEMLKLPQVELPTEHIFAGGMYCRILPRPAGCLIVGKVHKFEHLYMVVKGKVRVTTDDGVQDIEAPRVIVSKPGTKRAVLALEDSVCLTVHRTDLKTVEEVDDELVEPDETSLYGPGNVLRIECHS
jgi:hypothetical protein